MDSEPCRGHATAHVGSHGVPSEGFDHVHRRYPSLDLLGSRRAVDGRGQSALAPMHALGRQYARAERPAQACLLGDRNLLGLGPLLRGPWDTHLQYPVTHGGLNLVGLHLERQR